MKEKLIVSVSAFPELFNSTLAGYKDRTVKTKAWLKRETSSNMVLGVEVDGIAEYPVGDQGSEAARGTASDLGDLSSEEPVTYFKNISCLHIASRKQIQRHKLYYPHRTTRKQDQTYKP
ncbi:unnamed protein product [Boreogadus saida]